MKKIFDGKIYELLPKSDGIVFPYQKAVVDEGDIVWYKMFSLENTIMSDVSETIYWNLKFGSNYNVAVELCKNFVSENYHITDLINMINENIEREQTSIKQNLIKADFVILSIGMNDYTSVEYLSNKNENLLSLQNDYVRLFEILRKNTKEKIIMIGLYDNTSCNSFSKSLFELNEFLKRETKIYSIDYIDILKEMKDINNLKCDSVYPTLYGYSLIENKIIAILN